MPRGERFEFDRLTEADFEPVSALLEINRGSGVDELYGARKSS